MIQSKLRETAKLALDVAKPMSNLVGKDDDISNSPYALISKFFPHMAKLMLEAADELERYKAALAKCKEQRDESVMLHEHLETRREKYAEINKYEAEIETILAEHQPTEASQVGIGSHEDEKNLAKV